MSGCACKIWEVAIYTPCVVNVQQGLTKDEACDCLRNSQMPDGSIRWTFPNGEMLHAQAGTCVLMSRIMYEHREAAK